ncbi:MAG: RsmE family RNA methyltransferase [Bacillota bacterium]|jgi:16S rRNA (uracil1498-N3)-methyltransferase|nr:RsmE family RNA methyltransferase [Bacillota bacterium]NLL26679.1 16S rRNA (uracil(1498)-N(3))-methyltransferase [Erysipelotrichia bacterium]
MRQYFVEKKLEINEIFDFNEKQSHHIKTVLRMKVGEKIRVVDSNNDVFLVEIDIDSKVRGKVLENIFDLSDVSEITYCAALIKKDKWNFLLQKAAELGATKVVPLISNRTIFKIDEQRLEKRIQRWNKITLEACQQSNRSSKCEVERPIKLKEIDKFLSENNIVAYENEQNICLADCIDEKSITFVIGPEGGLTEDEIEYLQSLNFTCVSLGKRILRAETAGLYVLSVIDAKRNSL